MRHRLAFLVLAALFAVAACGSHPGAPAPRASSDADARAFALRLIDVLERDDLDGWHDLLSARVQHRTDDAELRRKFDAWRQLILPYALSLRDADWTLAYNDAQPGTVVRYRAVGTSPEPLVRVVDERGALRIDEN